MNFNNDTSSQIISSLTPSTSYNDYVLSSTLITSLANKQDLLTASTTLLGVGSNLTLVNYNTLSNLPSTFPPDMTNIYTKTQVDNITTLANYYNKTSIDSSLNLKQNVLTASTTLLGVGSNLTLVNYNTLSNLPNLSGTYLALNGGTINGNLTVNNSGTNKIIFNDALGDIKLQLYSAYGFGIQANTLLYTSFNTHRFMAGATQTMILNGSGNLTTAGSINATTNLQENGVNLSSKYLQLSGGTLTGTLTAPNLTTATSFIYKGTELTTTLNYYLTTATASATFQPILTASTILLGVGSNLTLVNYNTLSNLPSTFPPDMTNIYTKTQVDNITTLANYYNKTSIDSSLNLKQNVLTASTTLLGVGSNLTLVNYNTLSNLPNLSGTYLALNGGTLTGSLTINNSATNKIIFNDALGDIKLQLYSAYGLGIQANTLLYTSFNTHRFMAGATQTMILNGSGNLTTAGSINANGTAGISHNGPNISLATVDSNVFGTSTLYNAFAGDLNLYSYWGVSINLNNSAGNPANASYSRIANTSSFTINQKANGGTATSGFTNLFTVFQNGNVGIGTNNPSTKLDVRGGTYTQSLQIVDAISYTNQYQLLISSPTSTNGASIQTIQQGVGYSQNLALQPYGGNVGIGITNPANKLVVNGDYTFLNGLRISGQDGNTLYNDTRLLGITTLNNIIFNTGTSLANYATKMTIDTNNNIGIGNTQPFSAYDATNQINTFNTLCIGSVNNTSSGGIIISANIGGSGYRNCLLSYDNNFNFCISDYGNLNNNTNTAKKQLVVNYLSPQGSLVIGSSGYVVMPNGYGTSSDIKIKKDITTIDNALWKIMQLRGVYYTHIIEDNKTAGLIAQEVENIIPEAVIYNDEIDLKTINFSCVIGVLVNAIKEQQEIINNQESQIKNIMDILNRNNIT